MSAVVLTLSCEGEKLMKKRNPEVDELLAALADLRKNAELLVQEQKHLIEFCRVNKIDLKQHGYQGRLRHGTALDYTPKTNILGKTWRSLVAYFSQFTVKSRS